MGDTKQEDKPLLFGIVYNGALEHQDSPALDWGLFHWVCLSHSDLSSATSLAPEQRAVKTDKEVSGSFSFKPKWRIRSRKLSMSLFISFYLSLSLDNLRPCLIFLIFFLKQI